jgi:type II secretory pathway pseudopilin PulG
MRKAASAIMFPLLVVAGLFGIVAYVFGAAWMTATFNKKQRRDMAVAGAIRTFVKAGEARNKDNGEVQAR